MRFWRKSKPRIGKNVRGWFVAVPKFGGGHDVIEGLPSQQAACHVLADYQRSRFPWMFVK